MHLAVFRVMTRSLVVLAADDGVLGGARLRGTHWLCQKVYDWFGLDWLAENARRARRHPGADPAHRACWPRSSAGCSPPGHPPAHRPHRHRRDADDPAAAAQPRGAAATRTRQVTERRTQRAEAIGSVLRSFASIVVLGIAVVLVLGELGFNLAPMLASAGIVGVALGFGAQNLVKDFIAGISCCSRTSTASATSSTSARPAAPSRRSACGSPRLRDVNGVVWYVRNGEIMRVGNKSQGCAQVVDRHAGRPHGTDLETRPRGDAGGRPTRCTPTRTGRAVLLAEPESLGVEQITAEGVFLRLAVARDQRRPVAGRPRAADAAQGALRRRGLPHAAARCSPDPPAPRRGSADRARAGGDLPAGATPRQATFREVFAVREFRPLFGTFLLSTAGDELRPGRPHRAGLPAHLVPAAVRAHLRHRPPAVAARRAAALDAGRPPAPAPGAHRDRRRPGGAPRASWRSPACRCRSCSALLFLVSLCAPPFESARSALMADVLDGDRYAVATSLTNITLQLAQVVGFLAAGALVAVCSPSAALLIDAATFAVSARLAVGPACSAVRPRDARRATARARCGRTPRTGCGSSAGRRACWRSSACSGWPRCSPTPSEGVAAPLVDELGQAATALGVLLAANPLGVIDRRAGDRPAGPPGPARAARRPAGRAVAAAGPGRRPGGVLAGPGHVAVRLVVGLLFVSGLGAAWVIPLNVSFVQAVPSAYRGRAFGVAVSGLYGVQGIGALAAGLPAEGMPPSGVVALSGGLGLIAVAPRCSPTGVRRAHMAATPAGEGPSAA